MNRSKYSTVLLFYLVLSYCIHVQSTVLQILSEENFLQKTNPSTPPSFSFLRSTFTFNCIHFGIIQADCSAIAPFIACNQRSRYNNRPNKSPRSRGNFHLDLLRPAGAHGEYAARERQGKGKARGVRKYGELAFD
jgi:hypothetical protein